MAGGYEIASRTSDYIGFFAESALADKTSDWAMTYLWGDYRNERMVLSHYPRFHFDYYYTLILTFPFS